MSETYDAIVLGLGAMGSAALYQLARRGKRVLGVDQFVPPHALGSTHGDSRITRLATGEGGQYVPLVRRSHELWREIERATGEELLTITGGLVIAAPGRRTARPGHEAFLEGTLAAAREHHVAHEVLDAAEVQRRFPQFRLEGDETAYYEPTAGFLRPERCVAAQLALAERHGAQIRRNTRVLALSPAGNDRVTVTTTASEYAAEQLVLTAGPWLAEFLDAELAALFPVYRQVMYWFAPRGSAETFTPARLPIFIWYFGGAGEGYLYGIPLTDESDGGVKIATAQYEATTRPDAVTCEVTADEIGVMYRDFVAGRLPGLSDRCLRTATCLYTVTPDGGFVIDRHPRWPNVLLASPCSGHGFKHSAAIGEALAELVTDGGSRLDLRPFALGRFSHQQTRT